MERRAFIRHTGRAGVLAAAAAPAVVHAGGELMPPFSLVDGVQNGTIEMGHTVPCSRSEAMQGGVDRNILSKKTGDDLLNFCCFSTEPLEALKNTLVIQINSGVLT